MLTLYQLHSVILLPKMCTEFCRNFHVEIDTKLFRFKFARERCRFWYCQIGLSHIHIRMLTFVYVFVQKCNGTQKKPLKSSLLFVHKFPFYLCTCKPYTSIDSALRFCFSLISFFLFCSNVCYSSPPPPFIALKAHNILLYIFMFRSVKIKNILCFVCQKKLH